MKNVILTLALSIVGLSASAQATSVQSNSDFTTVDRGAQIASIVSKVLASPSSAVTEEAKEALAAVIAPQSYEARASITSFGCTREGYNGVSCDIEIGTDDLTDDDSGWGTIKRVTVDGVMIEGQLKVRAATLFLIAG